MAFKCLSCKRKYTRKKDLENHCEKVHSGKTFECDSCAEVFSKRKAIIRHIKYIHNSFAYECHHCKRKLKTKRNLTNHIDSFHNNQNNKTTTATVNRFTCGICNEVFISKASINEHYPFVHKITLETQKVTLKSFEEFTAWKSNTQRQTITQFVKQNSFKTSSQDRQLFICHRSSYNRTDSRRKTDKRFPRCHGSKKLHTYCPAEMDVRINRVDGMCIVNYVSTHIGHTLSESEELQHIHLTKNERLYLAARLKDNIPRNDLRQEDISFRNMGSKFSILRTADFKNVEVSFCIDENISNSDDIDIDIFVENNKESVLYYKNWTMVDSKFGILKNDDFVLILMNKTQEKYLQRYGENVVCFDSARSTNKYHFLLHTLLVLDVDRVGYPAAFLITNRYDKTVIEIFLQCIKDRVGDIKTRILMSNMQNMYYGSWISVMDAKPLFYLNCTWYINEAWRRKYPKKSEIWSEVKQQLHSLCSESDPLLFEEKLVKFLTIDNKEVKKFINYFRDNFAQNAHLWAYCYRLHAGTIVNMSLETFHKELKYRVINDRHTNNWLSHTLKLMKKYLDGREADVRMKTICGLDSSKLTKLRRAHHDALKYCDNTNWDESLFVLDNETYYVNEEDVAYVVNKNDGVKACSRYEDVICGLQCQLCEICFHEYECSCLENSAGSNMCKHIHIVGLYIKKYEYKTRIDTSISTTPSVPVTIASQSLSAEQFIDEKTVTDTNVKEEINSNIGIDDETLRQLKSEAYET